MSPDLVIENLTVTCTAILPKFGECVACAAVFFFFNFNLERHERMKKKKASLSLTPALHLTCAIFLSFSSSGHARTIETRR